MFLLDLIVICSSTCNLFIEFLFRFLRLCGGSCNRVLIISGLLDYFLYLLFNFSTCNLCSQVENSSTAQVGGPHEAADVVEPILAGSDVPLPEDGFTHEVNCFNLPYS
jgi:hypothetical protein